jgi:hypothetical protein
LNVVSGDDGDQRGPERRFSPRRRSRGILMINAGEKTGSRAPVVALSVTGRTVAKRSLQFHYHEDVAGLDVR